MCAMETDPSVVGIVRYASDEMIVHYWCRVWEVGKVLNVVQCQICISTENRSKWYIPCDLSMLVVFLYSPHIGHGNHSPFEAGSEYLSPVTSDISRSMLVIDASIPKVANKCSQISFYCWDEAYTRRSSLLTGRLLWCRSMTIFSF
jgi:hypothetical protein